MTGNSLKQHYFFLVQRYLTSPGETQLTVASELGRQLVLDEVPPEEVAQLLREALHQLVQEVPDVKVADAVSAIAEPLSEILMAYGLLFNAMWHYTKEDESLRKRLDDIERKIAERTAELKKTNGPPVLDEAHTEVAEGPAKDSQHPSRDIFHAFPSGLFIFQYLAPDNLFLLDGNPVACRLIGLEIAEWMGFEFDEVLPQARNQGLTEGVLRTMETGETFECDEAQLQVGKTAKAVRIRAFCMPGDRLCVCLDDTVSVK